MKTCYKCGVAKELSEFCRDKSTQDGINNWCKECCKKAHHKWYLYHRQLVIDHTAKWRKDNPEKQAELQARHGRKYKAKCPEKIKARQAVADALKAGRLIKEPCPCGEIEVQAHHESYEKEKWLDVDWLCEKCHNKLGKE